MQRFSDLEIGLRPSNVQPTDTTQLALDVVLRFVLSGTPIDHWKSATKPLIIKFNELHGAGTVQAYSNALTDMVFAHDEVSQFYRDSLATIGEGAIHFRLNLTPPSLHRVRWEQLLDPDTRRPLATSNRTFFSRYLTSPNFRSIPWRSRPPHRALVAIAGPSDIHEFGASTAKRLAKVNVEEECERAKRALVNMTPTILAGPGEATFANISDALVAGVEIFYLVCHGFHSEDVPTLLLEDDDGKTARVDGRRLVELIDSLEHRPVIVVLNSCQSAVSPGVQKTTDDGLYTSLGPRLSAAGVSAVIAMQDNVLVDTAEEFAQQFFTELQIDGVVDRSVAAARDALYRHSRRDWWVPVLFSRLRSGRTFFRSGFGGHEPTWTSLEIAHHNQNLTAVVGPGLADGILGSRAELARNWAEKWHMPLLAHNQNDVTRVAQYLRVERGQVGDVPESVIHYLMTHLQATHSNAQPGDVFHELDGSIFSAKRPGAEVVSEVITAVGKKMADRPGDAYRIAAGLPCEVFITTGWTQLLEEALKARGKDPQTGYFRWTNRDSWSDVNTQKDVERPSIERPFVYHLFGRLEKPLSLVLTEDDHLEWLAEWASRRQKLVPSFVGSALTDKPVLFLGYTLQEWDFRIVFQGINTYLGRERGKYTNVGVQLDVGNHLVEPESAQEYLESYFDDGHVSIFWADTQAFLEEYCRRTGLER